MAEPYGHPNPEPGKLYVLEKSYGLRLYTQDPGEHPTIIVETPLRPNGPTDGERAGALEIVRRWNAYSVLVKELIRQRPGIFPDEETANAFVDYELGREVGA